MPENISPVSAVTAPKKLYPIYLSYWAPEARFQALALKSALESHGFCTFCSETDIPQGKDRVSSDRGSNCFVYKRT